MKPSEISGLVVQDHAEEATMDRQPVVIAVIDKAQLPELIHEMTDPRPGCADHLCQAILTDSGEHRFGSAFLSKMSAQQKDPGQTLFARVEKLVDEIRFVWSWLQNVT
jgi:hypothetical protein